jgi:ABC-type Mn2+/Zn2+ transport system permease subunit
MAENRDHVWSDEEDCFVSSMTLQIAKSYIWLIAGLACLWIGLKGLYYIYAFDMPSSPSILVFVAPVCFYQFVKLRRGSKNRTSN